jgi:effector-binding domain-containing protein
MDYVIEQGGLPRQPYVAIRAMVPMAGIGDAMGPLYGRLFEWLGANGVEPSGPPWTRYLCMGPDELEFEVAAPIAVGVKSDGEVIAGTMPACEYVRTLHVGPYDALGAAYSAMMDWMLGHGLQPIGAFWEVYLTDPESEPDPAKWQTMVYCPAYSPPPS